MDGLLADGPTRRVAVAVVVFDGSVLVGRRRPDAINAAGFREFPGGGVEGNETPADAAVRETREETGIEISVGAVLDVTTTSSRAGPIEVVFLSAAPIPPVKTPLAPFAWTPIVGLNTADFPAANGRVIALLRGERIQREVSE